MAETIKVTCAKCGKEFDLDKKWEPFAKSHPERLTCKECKEANKEEGTTTTKKSYSKSSNYQGNSYSKSSPTLESLRKNFDAVRAEFKNELEEGFLSGEDIRAMAVHLNIGK